MAVRTSVIPYAPSQGSISKICVHTSSKLRVNASGKKQMIFLPSRTLHIPHNWNARASARKGPERFEEIIIIKLYTQ